MLMKEQITKAFISAFRIPTETPEADGTFQWDSTTLVTAQLESCGEKSFGYSYANKATAELAASLAKDVVLGECPFDISKIWQKLIVRIRNQGRPGISSMAISALDNSLW